MSGGTLGELAREVLALVHHLAGRDGVDARTVHTVINRPELAVQRVRSTLYNLRALGYVAQAGMSGLFWITEDCKAPPPNTPLRPQAAPAVPARTAAPPAPVRSIQGAVQRLHTPNSVFDVARFL
jgi:hypothetical protein